MAFWWVNQNKTSRQEIAGGYMWSPQKKRNGNYNQFYANMKLVEPGDIVFSYAKQQIRHIGIVNSRAVAASKPSEFGLTGDYWNDEGWFVPVEWYELPSPVRPKDFLDLLRPTLPSKYSPLKAATGDGLESVYLAAVPNPMAELIIERAGNLLHILASQAVSPAAQDYLRRVEDTIEAGIHVDTTLDETTKRSLVDARRGQGRFRRNVEEIDPTCRVTGVSDRRLLKASHIKPWRSCDSGAERLDGYNGLLLTPHFDHLFDRGYLSFEDSGALLISPRIAPAELALMGVVIGQPFKERAFAPQYFRYLEYHRANVFLD